MVLDLGAGLGRWVLWCLNATCSELLMRGRQSPLTLGPIHVRIRARHVGSCGTCVALGCMSGGSIAFARLVLPMCLNAENIERQRGAGRWGSDTHLGSSVPTVVDASNGVNTMWLRGEITFEAMTVCRTGGRTIATRRFVPSGRTV
jgi:hypothetical protein